MTRRAVDAVTYGADRDDISTLLDRLAEIGAARLVAGRYHATPGEPLDIALAVAAGLDEPAAWPA